MIPDDAADIFTDRCEGAAWRPDGTCDFCGGCRPSLALEAIKAGASVVPTDKSDKLYIQGGNLPSAGGKLYLNHFSQAQALEFVRLDVTGKMKVEFPGYFYAKLAFGDYKLAIQALLDELSPGMNESSPVAPPATPKSPEPTRTPGAPPDGMTSRVHVLPLDDEQFHAASDLCWCHPTFLPSGVICHHALDGREAAERQHGFGTGRGWLKQIEYVPLPK